MPFVPVLNTALIELRSVLFGQQVENTLYFRSDTAYDVTSLTALAEAAETWFTTILQNSGLSTDHIYRETRATDLTADNAPSVTVNGEAGETGNVAVASLPGNVAFTISFRTGERGRYARGRNYVCGIPESMVLGNQIDNGFATAMVDAYTQLIDTPLTGKTWVVVSRQFEGVPRATGLRLPIINVGYADGYLDSQRRRLTGRGN